MERGRKPRYEPKEIAIERELFIWELRITERKTYPQIAQSFAEKYGESISEAQISRILKKHREARREAIAELVDTERVEQDEILNWALAQAVSGWKKSLGDKRKAITTRKNGIDPKFGNEYSEDIETLETEEQAGDPRFLKVIVDASNRKSKLWGLDAAPKPAQPPEDNDPDPQGAKPWEALAAVIQSSRERIKREEAQEGNEDGG